MPSANAKAVAEEVLATLGKGRKVSVSAIARQKGYAPSYAKTPKNITETKTYRAVVDPVLDRMRKHRERILKALESKDLDRERFKDLTEALQKSTHDIQLLSGGATANIAARVHISEEKRVLVDIALSSLLGAQGPTPDTE